MAKTKLGLRVGAFGLLCLSSGIVWAQAPGTTITVQSPVPGLNHSDLTVKGPPGSNGGGQILTPSSSIAQPGVTDHMRTHYKIFVPNQAPTNLNQVSPNAMTPAVNGPPYTGYYYETPASLACIYQLVARDANGWCDPNTVTTVASGGSKVIAIVDAFHNSTVVNDLSVFSSQFGLPAANLQVIYMNSSGGTTTTPPPVDYGWAGEIALDVQMAHAMAPNAKIVLVEAYSNSNANLKAAVAVAVAQVQAAGGGQVSMSYGCIETTCGVDDTQFANISGNVVFFASTGDAPGIEFPSSSPNVVGVGGTSTARAWAVPANRGHFRVESGWAEAGSGFSSYFTQPSYQSAVAARLGNQNKRVVPDVSADANPTTGVWYYCTSGCGSSSTGPAGWGIVGGTSVASPLMAGMVNLAGNFRANTQAQLTWMYSKLGTSSFFDVDRSYCGPYAGYYATSPTVDQPGNPAYQFDPCTGLGSPRGLSGL